MRRTSLAILAVMLATASWVSAQPEQSPASADASGIGYPSVAVALQTLRAKDGVQVSTQSGWTIVVDPATMTSWTFTPSNHPAYPAALRRTIVEKDGALHVQTDGLCEAEKSVCDQLLAEFRQLDEKIRAALERKKTGG